MGFAALTLCLGILFFHQPGSFVKRVVQGPDRSAWPIVLLERGSAGETPCYSVSLDPTVPGGNARRTALGRSLVVENAVFMKQLERYLLDRLTDETWRRNNTCIEGSFVVNFSVKADGSLSSTKMLHHQFGGGRRIGIDIFDILDRLDRDGIRWHDGTLGKGEIILPIRFRIG